MCIFIQMQRSILKQIFYYLGNIPIIHDVTYNIENVKIKINIGSSIENIKTINLHYFPDDILYTITLLRHPYPDNFNFEIKNNILMITRIDQTTGWGNSHSIEISFNTQATIYLFNEKIITKSNLSAYVTYKNKKILDSRDKEYYYNKGW